MGSLLYFAFIAIHFTNSLAIDGIPMKCFFRDSNFLNLFDSDTEVPSKNTARFSTVKINPLSFNKDGWILEVSDVKFQGMDDAILDDIGFNIVTKVMQITFHAEHMLVTYNYKSDGSLFSQPINGEGSTEVPIKNIQFSMNMPFDIIEKDGNKYIDLKDFDISYNIKDKVEFKFSNLYYGDKELSDSMHSLMNKNWQYLATEFGKEFIDELGDNIFNVFRNYALDVPLRNFSSC